MSRDDDDHEDGGARVLLVDPTTRRVVWDSREPAGGERSLDESLPLFKVLGVPDAIERVVESGDAQHVQASLIPTSRGTVTVAASIHRLPDGAILIVVEHGWEARERDQRGARRGPRRRR